MKLIGAKYLIAGLVMALISFFLFNQNQRVSEKIVESRQFVQISPAPTFSIPTATPTPIPQLINLEVPFTSQAPFGNWKDPMQQDGCEEAVSLMAVSFAQGKTFTKQEALDQITNISNYEQENFGGYQDTSVDDTAERIIKGYFGYNNVSVQKNITIQDIINQLYKKRAVIVPVNGQIIGNPNYTAPGPDRHNLVIRGYDPKTKEFITNDNGTRLGENYRYRQNVLFSAIRDYPTGNHLPISVVAKNMIVVYK